MQKINFQNLPSTTTPINATNLNAIQTNVEDVFNGSEVAGNMIVEGISSKNMFDENAILRGYELIGSGTYIGGVNPNSTWYVSDFIEVQPNQNYYLTKGSSGSSNIFYNSNKEYVDIVSASSGVITIPNNNNIKYMRFNGLLSQLSNVQFEKGSSATTYTPYNAYGSNNLKTKNIVVGSIRTKNIFNKDDVDVGYFSSNGSLQTSSNYRHSNYIDVSGYNKITISGVSNEGTAHIIEYNESKQYVDFWGNRNQTITLNANTKYIRVSMHVNDLNTYQVEKGSTATSYTPYQSMGTNTDSGWLTLNSYIKYRKVNNIVYVVCDNNGFVNVPADSSYHAIGTLPTNYRPSIVIPFASHVYSVATKSIIGRVETNGNISIYANVSIDYFGFSIAFPV